MERYTVLVFALKKQRQVPDSANLGYFSDLPRGEQDDHLNIEGTEQLPSPARPISGVLRTLTSLRAGRRLRHSSPPWPPTPLQGADASRQSPRGKLGPWGGRHTAWGAAEQSPSLIPPLRLSRAHLPGFRGRAAGRGRRAPLRGPGQPPPAARRARVAEPGASRPLGDP